MGLEKKETLEKWDESSYKDSMEYSDKITDKTDMDCDQRTKIDKQKKMLPIFKVKRDLIRLIRENQVIVGETGSGKTTQLTIFIRRELSSSRNYRMYSTKTSCRRVCC